MKRISLILVLFCCLMGRAGAQTPTPRPPADEREAYLQQIPLLPESFSQVVYDTYARGQELGNLPNVFAKAGDSNSNSKRFLTELDRGRYDLGNYPELQATVDFFAGSYGRDSQSVDGGYNAFAILDSLLANPQVCEMGESPLTCEFRISGASLLFYLFGSNDLLDLRAERFDDLVRELVETSLEAGVVPVLTTYTQREGHRFWDKMMDFNLIVAQIAEDYEVPIINLWLGSLSLPDHGISEDAIHFNFGSQFVRLDGAETQWGHDLRNFLTLMLLDKFRREVILAEAS